MAKYGFKFEPELVDLNELDQVALVKPVYGNKISEAAIADTGTTSCSSGYLDLNANSSLVTHYDSKLILNRRIYLPDGAIKTSPDGGFTCTGIDRFSDGRWCVISGGKNVAADANFEPSVVILDASFSTILDEIDLDVAGLIPNASAQGCCIDNSGNIYVAAPSLNKIVHIDASTGLKIGGDISATSANGLAYDDINDQLIWCSASSSTIHIYDIDTSSEVDTYSIDFSDPDHLYFRNDSLYITRGDNGSDGNIHIYDHINQRRIARTAALPCAQAIEGVYVDGDTLYVANDGSRHALDGAYPARNMILSYPFNGNAYPGRTRFLGVHGKLTLNGSSPSDRECLITFGKPRGSSGGYGWAIYFMSNNELALQVRDNAGGSGSAYRARWPISRGSEFTFDVYVDLDAPAVYLEIDGVGQGAPTLDQNPTTAVVSSINTTHLTIGQTREDSPYEYEINADVRNLFVTTTLADFNEVKAINQANDDELVSDLSLTATDMPDGEYQTTVVGDDGNVIFVGKAPYASGASTLKGLISPPKKCTAFLMDNENPHVDGVPMTGTLV